LSNQDQRVAAGAIRAWSRGRDWLLLDGETRRDRITYRPDFEVWGPGSAFWVVDFKGCATEVFKLKAKLWRHAYPTIPLVVARADGTEGPWT